MSLKTREILQVLDSTLNSYYDSMNLQSLTEDKEKFEYLAIKTYKLLNGDILDRDDDILRKAHLISKVELQNLSSFIKGKSYVCRHRSLLFKYFCDKARLKCRVIRGFMKYHSLHFEYRYGGNVWNIIKYSDGKKVIFDIMNLSRMELI